MHEQPEAHTIPSRRPLEHLLVPIRITKGGNRTAADMRIDADRLSYFVIDEVDFLKTNEDRLSAPHLILRDDTAADNLLRRDAVHLLCPGPHEFDAAPRDYESLEPIRAQIRQQLQHRLINHLRVRLLRGWMPR